MLRTVVLLSLGSTRLVESTVNFVSHVASSLDTARPYVFDGARDEMKLNQLFLEINTAQGLAGNKCIY